MRKLYSLRFLSVLLLSACVAGPVYAGKRPKQLYKALSKSQSYAEKAARQVSHYNLPNSVGATHFVLSGSSQTLPAIQTSQIQQRLPRPPEQVVASCLAAAGEKNVLEALEKVWAYQDQYGNHNLFSVFIRQYYSQNFGTVSPHLQTLFNEVGALNDRRLEVRVIKRLQYLALNKINLIEKLFPESSYETLSSKTTRLRYLKNLNQLTAENFQEDQLVLSIEKQMSLNPKHDFPIRHVSGQAMVEVGNKYYPVYQHDISLNFMGNLYRFLLSGTKRHEPITVVFDSEGESLALFNKNKKLWLRITSHEYAVPNRLHVHLNELRTVEFINTYGVEKTEQVNLNLSIPLQAPAHLPKHQIKKYLYQLLIENPVKHFQGDAHATVEKHAIF